MLPENSMNFYLIGYRCTGKTTVGRLLAERLGWPLVDTDREIVDTAGMSIDCMVAAYGWPFFRQRESEVLSRVAAADRQVVATGGGIVLDKNNRQTMKTTGKVVWLTASETCIRTRMLADAATDDNRPPLTGRGLLEEIETVLAERKPLYENAADLTIATDRVRIEEICDRIVEALNPTTLTSKEPNPCPVPSEPY
jgi:shikimate kinase